MRGYSSRICLFNRALPTPLLIAPHLVLIIRIILSPFDIILGANEAVRIVPSAIDWTSYSIYSRGPQQDSHADFGFDEYFEGVVVSCFGVIPLGLSIFALMLIGLIAGWVSIPLESIGEVKYRKTNPEKTMHQGLSKPAL